MICFLLVDSLIMYALFKQSSLGDAPFHPPGHGAIMLYPQRCDLDCLWLQIIVCYTANDSFAVELKGDQMAMFDAWQSMRGVERGVAETM